MTSFRKQHTLINVMINLFLILGIFTYTLEAEPRHSIARDELSFKVTSVGQMGLMVWNYGLLGNGWNKIDGQILPSCQYRQYPDLLREQVEHFSYAGLWIGGIVNGQRRVSTAIVDGVFESGQEGFEFFPTSGIEIRSSISSTAEDTMAQYYSPFAISHQDFLINFRDYGDEPNDNFGIPNHAPLGIDIQLSTYSWNLAYAEAFVILNYTITNNSEDTINNLYAGIWADVSVANMNYTNMYEPGGGFTGYDNLNGFDESIDESGFARHIGYQYDADGDDGWAESYIGFSVLGGTVPTPYFATHYNQWVWSSATNTDYPEYVMPLSDYERYEQLSSSVPRGIGDLYTDEGYPNQQNSWLLMLSAGPLGSQPENSDSSGWKLPPGDSVNVIFAIVGARWNGAGHDSPVRRANLHTNADRAQKVYHGEDYNRNNILDEGEDIDGDGELDRFILLADPPHNVIADWNYPVITLTWEPPEQSVTGYNVYRNDTLMNPSPVVDTVFVDSTVTDSGVTSYYVVSVNEWGWESPPSRIVRDWSLPPSMEFLYGSNPSGDPSDTSYTFTTRTFTWMVWDPDGVETIANIYYALDDTAQWIELDGGQPSITLENIPKGDHIFYAKAEDDFGLFSPRISFPDTSIPYQPGTWYVMEPQGNVLLVDDFPTDSQNNAQNWYRSVLDTIVGVGNYSVWEIGERLPYSVKEVTANLNFFDHVIWYSAYTGTETYNEAASSILSFIMNGGNIFLNVIDFRYDTTFVWFPIDSLFTLNPRGRLFPDRTLVSQISPELDLEISSLIAVRVEGYETFLGDSLDCPQFRSLYRLQEPGSGDEWEGTPNVGGLYRFEVSPGQCSGEVVLMTLPLHSGYQPMLEGNGSAAKFISYLLVEEFGLNIEKENSIVPTQFHLYQNYPNPFNPVTTIRYELPIRTKVHLSIFNLLGQEVLILEQNVKPPGSHEVRWEASNLSSGIYFCRLDADGFVQTRKLLLIR